MKLVLISLVKFAVLATVYAGRVDRTVTVSGDVLQTCRMIPSDIPGRIEQACNGTECCNPSERDDLDFESTSVSEASPELASPSEKIQDAALGGDMGEAQVIDPVYANEILNLIQEASAYMKNEVAVEAKYASLREICVNKHALCAFWAALGECESNPGYMKVNCGPICKSCEMLHIETRCPMDPNAVDALYPGDLNKMFERIVTDPWYKQFEPIVLSRPSYAPGDGPENATYAIGLWMIMFDNAMSADEADRMIDLGGLLGYERSSDVGEKQADGTYGVSVNSGRTSTNAWCQGVCAEDPVAQRLMDRVENITGIPWPNSESFQLLRYEQGQFYQMHNDYISHQVYRPTGVRILTFYFYLNDVEEGGGTRFPKIGLEVTPKKGRAVLWPSVFDHDPNKEDHRSDHTALPVKKGIKYGCNAWIHQRDFQTNAAKGC